VTFDSHTDLIKTSSQMNHGGGGGELMADVEVQIGNRADPALWARLALSLIGHRQQFTASSAKN